MDSLARKQLILILSLLLGHLTAGFLLPNRASSKSTRLHNAMTPEELKQELEDYLDKRKELNADDLAKECVVIARLDWVLHPSKRLDFC